MGLYTSYPVLAVIIHTISYHCLILNQLIFCNPKLKKKVVSCKDCIINTSLSIVFYEKIDRS